MIIVNCIIAVANFSFSLHENVKSKIKRIITEIYNYRAWKYIKINVHSISDNTKYVEQFCLLSIKN